MFLNVRLIVVVLLIQNMDLWNAEKAVQMKGFILTAQESQSQSQSQNQSLIHCLRSFHRLSPEPAMVSGKFALHPSAMMDRAPSQPNSALTKVVWWFV